MKLVGKFKIFLAIGIATSVVSLSIGFAAMSTTLNIGGTATFESANWSIKFKNLGAVALTGAAEVITPPALADTSLNGFIVKLTRPGDSVTYTFDIANEGDMDAVISTFTKQAIPTCTSDVADDATLVCNNLTYTLKYTNDDTVVGQNDTLAADTTKNVTLQLKYDGTALPSGDVQISGLGITIIYGQV